MSLKSLAALAFAAAAVCISGAAQAADDAPRWRHQVCVGVTGLSAENAQFVVDRVSQRASEVGLTTRAPGCTPNVLVVFTTDANGQAASISREASDPASGTGRSGETLGLVAFNDFLRNDRPVRWWQVTRPTTELGQVAARNDRLGEAPRVNVPERGRLGQTTFNSFSHVIVIADLRQLNGVSLAALADYIALVSLAPVDPAADSQRQDTVLNLFEDRSAGRAAARGLTPADVAYLQELYN